MIQIKHAFWKGKFNKLDLLTYYYIPNKDKEEEGLTENPVSS